MTRKVLWMQAASGDEALVGEYAAIDDRQVFRQLFRDEGVQDIAGGSLRVTQRAAGANFSVDVAAGGGWVFGDDVTGQGMYLILSDAVENVTVPAPPATGSRIHRVVAQVKDKLHNSTDWAVYDWEPLVLEDTGSGRPAEPDSAITLAEISVVAGQTSVTNGDLNDLRKQACLLTSKPAVLSSAADYTSLVSYESEVRYRADLGCYEFYDGSEWREIPGRGGGGSAWSTYTPAWTSDGTQPSIGANGKRVGRYERIGRTVHVSAKIIMGSSTTYGSGQYSLSLPVPALTDDDGQVLMCEIRDASTGELYQGHARIFGPTAASLRVQSTGDDMNAVTQGGPITLAAGDVIRMFGTYEAAS